MNKTAILLGAALAGLAALAWFLLTQFGSSLPFPGLQEGTRERGFGGELYEKTENPGAKVPESNPFEAGQANPLEKTNPFGEGYRNPFGE